MKQTSATTPAAGGGHVPYVPDSSDQREFTMRALILGLLMCVVLGAANAYLGLRAGMTIAATYPAAVIGMAVLRLFKGSILEENFARTVGSIGESVAAGAIFTLPAFVILKFWKFDRANMAEEYLMSAALMMLGGTLGIMFVTILRRVMVEDQSLPFPESVAASEIHKAGQKGSEAALQLFRAMFVGAVIKLLDGFGVFRAANEVAIKVGAVKQSFVKLGIGETVPKVTTGGVTHFSAPDITPAYFGVGYIIGPELGSLNFAGGLFAWGLFVPTLIYFLGPVAHRPVPGRERRRGGGLGRDGGRHLEVHRAADRRRRHAGGRVLHALQDAQEPHRRRQARHRGRPEVRHGRGRHEAHRAGSQPQGGRASASSSSSC